MVLLMVIKLLKLGEIMSDKKFSFRKELEENSKKYNEVQNIQKQEIIDKRNEILLKNSDLTDQKMMNNEIYEYYPNMYLSNHKYTKLVSY